MTSTGVKYPIGIQSFAELRTNGYIYVDKTNYIPLLLSGKYYFLSRPRRFGKSLLLSTLEAYFKGKKELFEGLDIYDYENEWIEYPVVHIDFNTLSTSDIDSLLCDLGQQLQKIADSYDVPPNSRTKVSIGIHFQNLIESLHSKFNRKVVILIDEYDKGILDVIHDENLKDKATIGLRPFFGVLKTCDQFIKFAFITGVSRFRNTTIFSGANNLYDLTLDARFASMLGITHEEMTSYFNEGITNIANDYGYTYAEALEILRNKYDGYRFTRSKEYVYNPFSLLSAMSSRQLEDFWVASGTSRVLVTYLKGSSFSLDELTSRWVSGSELGSTYNKENPLSLFFQTGYLTVREFEDEAYKLGIPNQEVQKALAELHTFGIPVYAPQK